MWENFLGFLVSLQTWINSSVSADIKAFSQTRDWASLLAVLPLGIVFGAIHALTPGHSKTVLASYLAGSPFTALRGMSIAAILSVTHVFSAVMIAVLALPLVSATLGGAGRAPLLENISRLLLATIGLWMIIRTWKPRSHSHAEGPLVGVIAGLVPCPLTLFVMVLALSRGVPEAGLTFAVAMMLGVAFTLCLVALFTIFARNRLTHFLNAHGAKIELSARYMEGMAGGLLLLIRFGSLTDIHRTL